MYMDDMALLSSNPKDGFDSVDAWATENSMTINGTKTSHEIQEGREVGKVRLLHLRERLEFVAWFKCLGIMQQQAESHSHDTLKT
jgi:hypothetical protein